MMSVVVVCGTVGNWNIVGRGNRNSGGFVTKRSTIPAVEAPVAVCVYIDFLISSAAKTIRIIFSRSCWSFTGLVKSVLHYFYYYRLILLSDGVIYFILQWQFDMKVQFISS
jgi:hypothetical protein